MLTARTTHSYTTRATGHGKMRPSAKIRNDAGREKKLKIEQIIAAGTELIPNGILSYICYMYDTDTVTG